MEMSFGIDKCCVIYIFGHSAVCDGVNEKCSQKRERRQIIASVMYEHDNFILSKSVKCVLFFESENTKMCMRACECVAFITVVSSFVSLLEKTQLTRIIGKMSLSRYD